MRLGLPESILAFAQIVRRHFNVDLISTLMRMKFCASCRKYGQAPRGRRQRYTEHRARQLALPCGQLNWFSLAKQSVILISNCLVLFAYGCNQSLPAPQPLPGIHECPDFGRFGSQDKQFEAKNIWTMVREPLQSPRI